MKRNLCVLLFAVWSLGANAQVNTSADSALASNTSTKAAGLGAHLQPAGHFTLTIKQVVSGRNLLASHWISFAQAPDTDFQRNTKTVSVYTTLDGKPLSEAAVEKMVVDATSSDGKMKVGFQKWLPAAGDKLTGLIVTTTYSADFYFVGQPAEAGPASGKDFLGSTKYADFTNPQVQKFLDNLGLSAGSSSDLNVDVALLRAIGSLSSGSFHPASEVISKGGDCGGKSTLFEACERALGIPCRDDVGYLVNQRTGKVEIHVKPERLLDGWWIPMEPTGYRSYKPINTFMGSDGDWSPHLFTLHFGFGVHADFKDNEGQPHVFDDLTLQTPLVIATDNTGARLPVNTSVSISATPIGG